MRRFLPAILALTVMFALLVEPAEATDFAPGCPIRAPKMTVDTLKVTVKLLVVSGTDTISFWVTESVAAAALRGNLTGTWKGKDTTLFGVLARASTWTGAQSFSGAKTVLGDSSSGDTVFYKSQFLTQNAAGTSNWIPIVNPGALKRPSSFGHIGVRLYGANTGGYFNGLFVNTIQDTAAASGEVRGAEIKGTSEVTMTGTGKLIGVYAKGEMKGTSKTTPWTAAVYSILDIASGCTMTEGYNFYAENANSGTATASAILGAKANTWLYGVDFNGATFSTADIRLSKGATIVDTRATLTTITQDTVAVAGVVVPNSISFPNGGTIVDTRATLTTVTQDTVAVAGVLTASSVAAGTGSTGLTWKVIGDSIAFITGTDTMWAFQPGTK